MTESFDALMGLGLCIWLYLQLGLFGIGVALVLWHLLYMIMIWVIYTRRYGYRLGTGALNLLIMSLLASGLGYGAVVALPGGIYIPLLLLAAGWFVSLFVKMFRHRRKGARKIG